MSELFKLDTIFTGDTLIIFNDGIIVKKFINEVVNDESNKGKHVKIAITPYFDHDEPVSFIDQRPMKLPLNAMIFEYKDGKIIRNTIPKIMMNEVINATGFVKTHTYNGEEWGISYRLTIYTSTDYETYYKKIGGIENEGNV